MKHKVCAQPGCFRIVEPPSKYCQAHQWEQAEHAKQAAEQATKRWTEHHAKAPGVSIYHTARWRKLRAQKLKDNPVCEDCGAVATSVDHVIPHRGREEFAYNLDNLRSLCASCHAKKSRKDRDR